MITPTRMLLFAVLFLIAASFAAAQTTTYTIPVGFHASNIEGTYYPEEPVNLPFGGTTQGWLVTGSNALYFEWATGGNNNGTEPWAEYCGPPSWTKTLLSSGKYEFKTTCQANAEQTAPGSPSATIAVDIIAHQTIVTFQCGRYICHMTEWVVDSGGATITIQ